MATAVKQSSRRKVNLAELQESAFSGSAKVDRVNGIIRNVKILGKFSTNHGEYTREALLQAAEHYDGQRVNIDHPDRKTPGMERSLRDSFGWLESVKIRDDGVYGDLHYFKSHPLSEQICEMAERCPNKLGLSHNAVGYQDRRQGRPVVESVDRVRSVDLVQKPATTSGLFESVNPEEKGMRKAILASDGEGEGVVLSELQSAVLEIVGSGRPIPEKLKMIEGLLKADIEWNAALGKDQHGNDVLPRTDNPVDDYDPAEAAAQFAESLREGPRSFRGGKSAARSGGGRNDVLEALRSPASGPLPVLSKPKRRRKAPALLESSGSLPVGISVPKDVKGFLSAIR